MNLAEIRKKARRERDAGRQLPGEKELSPRQYAPAPSEAEVPGSDEPLSAAAKAPSSGSSAPMEPDQPTPEAPGDVFDPVSVILAGRMSADTAVERTGQPSHDLDESGGLMKYLRFRVADEDYGVSLLEIREIIKNRPVTEVPHMPAFVAGILSLRGTIIPILDLRVRLGFAAGEDSGRERIIIANRGEGLCGLLVDEVFQVIGLSEAEIEKAPQVLDGVDREFVRGIGRHGERMLIILDLEKVMDVQLR